MFNLRSVTHKQQKLVEHKTKEHCITWHVIRVSLYTRGGKLLGERLCDKLFQALVATYIYWCKIIMACFLLSVCTLCATVIKDLRFSKSRVHFNCALVLLDCMFQKLCMVLWWGWKCKWLFCHRNVGDIAQTVGVFCLRN